MTQKSNEEQLQLFDPDHYLALDGNWYTNVEFDDDELQLIMDAAENLGMTFNEYINRCLQQLAVKKIEDHE